MFVKQYASKWDFVTDIFCKFCIIDQKVLSAYDTVNSGFLCCPGRVCEPSLRRVGQDFIELLVRNRQG